MECFTDHSKAVVRFVFIEKIDGFVCLYFSFGIVTPIALCFMIPFDLHAVCYSLNLKKTLRETHFKQIN